MNNILISLFIIIHFMILTIKSENWDHIHIICPNQCVCQYSHFMDLSIARWIRGIQMPMYEEKTNENENEAYYENDDSHQYNPILKFAVCMLQANGNPKDLFISLPQDVQALVLLYNSNEDNITISTSELLILMDLMTLEIRGTNTLGKNLKFIIDEPLANLKYANFESIELLGSDKLKRNPNSVHPSENFDYIPDSKQFNYNISIEVTDEIEIVPYDVYLMEIKKSKIVSFYGWLQLTVLRIHCSKFTELHWEMFDGLNSLQHLSLEHNDIKVIPPFAFYGALHIKTLSIARNNILDLNYRALAGLLELEYLNLSSNNLTKLSELTFPPFPKLSVIDCRQNPIKYIFPMTFGIMNNTKKMYLGSNVNALELSIGSSFLCLEQLTELIILNGTTTVLNQQIFKGLRNLEILKIHGQIKKIEFDAFVEMPKLIELYLQNCFIQEISMDTFYGIKYLEVVDLSMNNITILPPGVFDEQRNLKEIYLQNNNLAKLPLHFFNNTNIKLVRLINNPWVCTCEMNNWKQAITNRIRSKRLQEKCLYNKKTGEKMKCDNSRNEFSYIFDNKLSPRCDGGPTDLQYRSVYYTLRKHLKCKIVNSTNVSSTNKLVRHRKFNKMNAKINNYIQNMEQTQHMKKLFKEKTTMNYHNYRHKNKLLMNKKNPLVNNELKYFLNTRKIEVNDKNSYDNNILFN